MTPLELHNTLQSERQAIKELILDMVSKVEASIKLQLSPPHLIGIAIGLKRVLRTIDSRSRAASSTSKKNTIQMVKHKDTGEIGKLLKSIQEKETGIIFYFVQWNEGGATDPIFPSCTHDLHESDQLEFLQI